jgi:hypothetical protein
MRIVIVLALGIAAFAAHLPAQAAGPSLYGIHDVYSPDEDGQSPRDSFTGWICFDCGPAGIVVNVALAPPVTILDLGDPRFPPDSHCPDGAKPFESSSLYFVCIDGNGLVMYPIPNKPTAEAPQAWDALYGTPVHQLGPIRAFSPAAMELGEHRTGTPLRLEDKRTEFIVACNAEAVAAVHGGKGLAYARTALRAGDFDTAFCWLTGMNPEYSGDDEASVLLGVCYEMGWGTPPDPETAFHFYEAGHSEPLGQFLMMRSLLTGGTEANQEDAGKLAIELRKTVLGRDFMKSAGLQRGQVLLDLATILSPREGEEIY